MAIKDFIAGRGDQAADPAGEAPQSAQPAPRPARSVEPSSRIDAATELKGTLRSRETLRVDGRIEGEIYCEKNVIVGQAASIHALIEGAEVTVAGEVKGNITANRKITLEATARVVGDLRTPGIVIQEGAKLEGRIVIGAEEQPQAQTERAPGPAPSAQAPAAQSPAPKISRTPSASV